MINAFRFGILGVSDLSLPASFGIILAFIAALFAIALHLLDRGVGIRT
jgi:ABC-2 type transport system permease protein